MPPRHVYWTIILEGKPTAFRAHTREELQPTFKQLLVEAPRHPNEVVRTRQAVGRPTKRRTSHAAAPARAPRGLLAARWQARRSARAKFKIPRDEKRRRFRERLFRDNVPEDRETPAPEKPDEQAPPAERPRETPAELPVVEGPSATRGLASPASAAALAGSRRRGKEQTTAGPSSGVASQAARGQVARRGARAFMDSESTTRRRWRETPMEPQAIKRRREAPMESRSHQAAARSAHGVRSHQAVARNDHGAPGHQAVARNAHGVRSHQAVARNAHGIQVGLLVLAATNVRGLQSDRQVRAAAMPIVHGDRSGRQRKVEAAAREEQAANAGGNRIGRRDREALVVIAAGSRDARLPSQVVVAAAGRRASLEESRQDQAGQVGIAADGRQAVDEKVAAEDRRVDRPRRPGQTEAGDHRGAAPGDRRRAPSGSGGDSKCQAAAYWEARASRTARLRAAHGRGLPIRAAHRVRRCRGIARLPRASAACSDRHALRAVGRGSACCTTTR